MQPQSYLRLAFKLEKQYCLLVRTYALSACHLHSRARIGSCRQGLFDVCWLSCFWCIVFQEADQQQNECTESDDRHRPLGPAPSKVPAFTHFLVRCNNNRKDQKVSDILDNEGANQRASSEATSLHDDKNAHRLCSVFQEEDIANHLGA